MLERASKLLGGKDFVFVVIVRLNQIFLGTTKFGGIALECPPWLQACHKIKVASKFQRRCWLLPIETLVLENKRFGV